MEKLIKNNIVAAFLVSAIVALSVSFAFADSWITIGTGDIGGGSGTAPAVTGVSPNSGVNTLETTVTITGTEFVGVTAVNIGTWPVSSYTVVNSTTITAVIQSGLPVATYHVTATNPYGTSAQTPADLFTVKPGNGDIIIDNYEENYRTDDRGQMDYYFGSGAAGEVTIPDPANSTTVVYEGLKSMELAYPGATSGQWGGFWGGGLSTPATDAIDISSANMLVYYVKGDGTGNTERLSVTEYKDGTNDEPYRALDSYGLDNSGSFKEIKIPYTRIWRDEYAGSVKDDNVFSGKVKNYTFVYTGTNPTSNKNNIDLIKAVNWAGPVIDLLGPSFGPVGISVEVIGRNFGATQGSSIVTLNGLSAPVISWSAGKIIMTVPSGATSGPVEVTVGGFVSNGVPFTVTTTPDPAGPMITAITPNIGPAGTTAVITGTNFLADPGAANRSTASYHITFGLNRITAANVLAWSDTSITVIVPGIPDGVYPVQVRSNDKESNFVDFTVGIAADTEPPTSVFGNSMVKNGSDLTLGWTPATDNVGVAGYHIYRSSNPVFTPSISNRVGSSPTNSYTDAGALSAADSYYYKVKAFDAASNESVTASNIGYKLNKHIDYKVSISNIYWLSIPNITPYKNARDIATDIPYATKVTRFNPSTQTYENLEKFLGNWIGTNFNVTTGESYAVVVGATSEARLVGWYYPYTINIPYNSAISNINWTSVPYNSIYAKVSDVAVTVPNATKIVRFNPQTQLYERWEKFLGSWIGTDFAITPGEGYGIIVNSNSTWLPGVNE